MEVKELMINNLLQSELGIVRVESILGSRLRVHCNLVNEEYFADYFIEDLKPIQLTEEWLVKMGFGYSVSEASYSIFFDDYNGVLRIKPIGTELNVWMKRNNRTIRLVEVNYVHQLQNLYFALTGEELTIGS